VVLPGVLTIIKRVLSCPAQPETLIKLWDNCLSQSEKILFIDQEIFEFIECFKCPSTEFPANLGQHGDFFI
jgi:hypothetical protein